MYEISIHESESGIFQKDIAENQELPLKYLDAIITGLRAAGLIVNYSGKSSGYRLARKAKEISVYDVYRAFEPELTIVNCVCPTNDCKREDTCPAKDYWFDLNKQIKNWMQGSTLESINNRVPIN